MCSVCYVVIITSILIFFSTRAECCWHSVPHNTHSGQSAEHVFLVLYYFLKTFLTLALGAPAIRASPFRKAEEKQKRTIFLLIAIVCLCVFTTDATIKLYCIQHFEFKLFLNISKTNDTNKQMNVKRAN